MRSTSTTSGDDGKAPAEPAAKQKLRVYNAPLLTELLQETEKHRAAQAEVCWTPLPLTQRFEITMNH